MNKGASLYVLSVVIGVAFLLGTAGPASSQSSDLRAHDPVMIRQDSVYYLFATGRGISVASSVDMENWTREEAVFAEAPTWVGDVVPNFRNHIWAPDIFEYEGRYYLYYSVSAFGRNTSAIGVASTPTLHPNDPDFRWTDHGTVVQSVPGRDMWNAIDPNIALDDEGTPWISFGSYWSGLKLVKLDTSLTALAQPQEWYAIAARHRYWKLDERDAGDTMNGDIEAPFIFKKDSTYYLFASWDRCCSGVESTYKIVVGRADAITGPYLDKEGEDMRHGGGSLVVRGVEESERWVAVGHNSAYTFDDIDYLVFHAYDLTDEGRSKLIVQPIEWDEQGWPSVSLSE